MGVLFGISDINLVDTPPYCWPPCLISFGHRVQNRKFTTANLSHVPVLDCIEVYICIILFSLLFFIFIFIFIFLSIVFLNLCGSNSCLLTSLWANLRGSIIFIHRTRYFSTSASATCAHCRAIGQLFHFILAKYRTVASEFQSSCRGK